MTDLLRLTSLHEPGHLLGLVSPTYLRGDSKKHNTNFGYDFTNPHPESYTPYVMNENNTVDIRLNDFHIDKITKNKALVQFKQRNINYLLFILPTPNQGN